MIITKMLSFIFLLFPVILIVLFNQVTKHEVLLAWESNFKFKNFVHGDINTLRAFSIDSQLQWKQSYQFNSAQLW